MEWEVIPRDEQETIMNIDYFEKTINVYTTRKSVGERLKKKIGEPAIVYKNNEKIYAVEYKKNLFDKDVSKLFSKLLLVGSFKENEKQEADKNDRR